MTFPGSINFLKENVSEMPADPGVPTVRNTGNYTYNPGIRSQFSDDRPGILPLSGKIPALTLFLPARKK
jgi:hypothetical protein